MKVAVMPRLRATPFNHIFVDHHIVGHAGKRGEAHINLALAAGRHFMVVGLNLNTELLKEQHHFGAHILERVGGGNRKIALLGTQLVTQARAIALARVPVRLTRFDLVEAVIRVLVIAYAVEHKVLELGTEIGRVTNPCSLQEGFRLCAM
jgi:hypothetical protein